MMVLDIILILVIATPIVAIVLDSQIAKAFATRITTPKAVKIEDELLDRVRFLETEVERLSEMENELQRIAEENYFTQKLLMSVDDNE